MIILKPIVVFSRHDFINLTDCNNLATRFFGQKDVLSIELRFPSSRFQFVLRLGGCYLPVMLLES